MPGMAPTTFELQYDLTPEDASAWEDYWYTNLVLNSRLLDVLAIILGAIIGLAVVGTFRLIVWAIGLTWDPLLYWLYFYGIVGGMVVAFVVFRTKRGGLRKRLLTKLAKQRDRKHGGQQFGRRNLLASADGFEIESPVGKTSRKWTIVRAIDQTDTHIFITADVAVIIPKTALESAMECTEFFNTIERWHKQAQGEDEEIVSPET